MVADNLAAGRARVTAFVGSTRAHGTFRSDAFRAWENGVVALAKKNNREALDALYRTFARPLYETVIAPRLRNDKLAEDVLAETFETMLVKLSSYLAGDAGFWAWLSTIAVHKCIDAQRKRNTSAKRESVGESALTLVASEDEPSRPLQAMQLRQKVVRCLGTITPRYQRAIELRFFEERERAECAEALAVSLATFDVVLLRAVRAFAAVWTQRPSYPEDA